MVTASAETLVQITWRRENVPLDLADGHGGMVHFAPNETKTVRGSLEYFRRAAKNIGGLVVKPAPSTVTKADHDRSSSVMMNDVHRCRISNYRDIPMRLATGVDRQYAEIPRSKIIEDPTNKGKKTKVPGTVICVARVSLIKQMNSIKVEILDEDEEKKPAPVESTHRDTGNGVRETLPQLKVNSDPEVPRTSEPLVADLQTLRKNLELPETLEGFAERAKAITWHDLRGICSELGFSRPKSREHATQLICEKLYPQPESDESTDETTESDESDESDEKSKKSSKKK